ncbi:MAG: hypothetical protein IJT97_09485 [Bacteroidaceae bacterium]|nr:hypothetical protein [Bacteroidaceae bacterium]
MKQKLRFFIFLMAFVSSATGAWALDTDTDGYYLIGSVQDWQDFATLVQTTPTANAKMIADIDLGTDQTVIGGAYNGSTLFYQGTFDGQGHTLTIAYNVTSGERFATPFSLIQGATIRNLHLDGTVNSVYAYGGSISSILKGTNTIENVWNSVTAVCTMGGWVQMGTFVGVLDGSTNVTINDCLFTGSITHNGGYSGYFNGGYGPQPTVNNSLVLGTFSGSFGFNGNYINCYCKHASTTGVTQPSDDDLSDGTTTTALNNGRTGDDAPWVQEGSQPMLKLFALQQDGDNYYLLGNASQWKQFANIVTTTPTANAKMTADIDLGTCQTVMGSSDHPYSGTFDGQGFTLTVHLNSTTDGVAPFRSIDNATIKNLAVAGSVTGGIHSAGLVGGMPENSTFNLITNVMVSATITTTGSHCGGILGHGGSTTNTTIQDCLFNGIINGRDGGSTIGVIWGWQTYGHANITNCLENGTYTNCSSFNPVFQTASGPATVSGTYYVTGSSTYGTQANATTMSDGTVTDGLNAGRINGPWVQDAVSGEPRLDLFMATTSLTANEGKTGEYWSTYYDGAKSCIADANTTVYTGALNGDKIDLTEVADKTIPAGNAVILKSTAANVTLTKTSATGTLAGNGLKGTDVGLVNPGNAYCLSKNGTIVGFYKFTADGTIPAHRAYIVIPAAGSRSFYGFGDDDTTGLEEMSESLENKEDGVLYDLTGRTVTGQPRKGIYVRHGEKIIIK